MHLCIARSVTRVLIGLSVLIGSMAGCGLWKDQAAENVHYVQIRDTISPMHLYVSVGDQVRWQNLRGESVRIGLLTRMDLEQATCERGFRHFGVLDDFVTIKPRDYVSLCFARPGLVRYNVWLDANDSKGAITRTAVIHIDRS